MVKNYRRPSPATLAAASAKLRELGELKLADALSVQGTMKLELAQRTAAVNQRAKVRARSALHRGVRALAMKRCGGRCEAWVRNPKDATKWSRCSRQAVEHDHFFGRAVDKTLFGSWMHCAVCGPAKTESKPSRLYWLRSFHFHLVYVRERAATPDLDAGYTQRALKCLGQIAIEEVQHPEPAAPSQE